MYPWCANRQQKDAPVLGSKILSNFRLSIILNNNLSLNEKFILAKNIPVLY